MKASTQNDNNFGYEKITIVVDNMPLIKYFKPVFVLWVICCYITIFEAGMDIL
jgi:hypothetical protein